MLAEFEGAERQTVLGGEIWRGSLHDSNGTPGKGMIAGWAFGGKSGVSPE